MYTIGLTGGIASGKSTISKTLNEKYNIPVIDGDLIAYELSKKGGAIWKSYVDRYGRETALLPDDELNREAIAALVFSSDEEKRWMDNMAFPLVWNEIEKKLADYEENNIKIAVLDIPLLFEAGWDKRVNEAWVVYVNPQAQLDRLMKRNGLTKENALQRIAAQMSLEEKKKRAAVVIDNSGSLDDTLKQLDTAWRDLQNKEK